MAGTVPYLPSAAPTANSPALSEDDDDEPEDDDNGNGNDDGTGKVRWNPDVLISLGGWKRLRKNMGLLQLLILIDR